MQARWALTLVVTMMATSSLGRADTVDDCIHASSAGQEARKSGKLADAARDFAQCSQASCPAPIRRDCARWVEEVELATPTVIFAASDAQGRDRGDVRVFVDGAKVLERLDGRPLSMDPGVHTVRYEGPGGAAANEELVARVGEKNRLVSMLLVAPAPPPSTSAAASTTVSESRPVPVVALTLGGFSLVALGVAGYLDFSATGDAHTLRSTCDPRCLSSDVDAVDSKYRVAAVALGASVVLAGVALYLFLTSRDDRRPQRASAPRLTADSPAPPWGFP